MTTKNLACATLGLCGSLLAMTVSTAPRAAEQAAEQQAKQTMAAAAKQETLMCRDLDIPGSHIKQHVCGTPAQWSDAKSRLILLRENHTASSNFGGEVPYSGTTVSTSGFQR